MRDEPKTAALEIVCVQTSPISFVPFPRATKEIGDVCTQATLETNFTSEARNSHHLINKPDADVALISAPPPPPPPPPPPRVCSSILRFYGYLS